MPDRALSVTAGFDVTPGEALAFFRRKGMRTSFRWEEVWKAEHEAAFTVAKMADVDLLADVRAAVERAIAEGETLAQFRAALEPMLQKAGWWGIQVQKDPLTGLEEPVQLGSPRRLETIFRTNLQTAYAAGDWAQIQETADTAPYLMYDAVDDNRTRPAHRAWDGLVLPISDPFWDTHRPPNGWNCRCSVIQVGERELRRMGKGVDEAPPLKTRDVTNRHTGEVMHVPVGIDAGWDYNPGAASRQAHLEQTLRDKRAALEAR